MNRASTVFVLTVAFGVVSYYTYSSYQKYITVQKSTTLSSFLDEMESVVEKIESERFDSARYLVSQEKSNLDQLQKTRVSVDLASS